MKDRMHTLPSPLQNQILLRIGLCGFALVAGGGMLLALGQILLMLPFVLSALLLAANAAHLYRVAVLGRYLVLKGIVLKVERTALRRRPKALLLAVDGKALRVVLHNRHRAPTPESSITLYILDTAPLYEWHGLHQLSNYLALVGDE